MCDDFLRMKENSAAGGGDNANFAYTRATTSNAHPVTREIV